MSEWRRTIDQIDRQIKRAMRQGLFTLIRREHFTVTDEFDTGAELLEEAPGWAGTTIDPGRAKRVADEPQPIRIEQTVRLQVLEPRRHEHFSR